MRKRIRKILSDNIASFKSVRSLTQIYHYLFDLAIIKLIQNREFIICAIVLNHKREVEKLNIVSNVVQKPLP